MCLILRSVARLLLVVFTVIAPASAIAQQITGVPGSPSATTTIGGRYLPPPPQPFQGDINLNAAQPTPA